MQTNKFNIDLLVDVIGRRNKSKLVYFERGNENTIHKRISDSNEIDSDLKGRTVLACDTRKQYIVDRVFKQWHKGYYIVLALVDDNRSHRMLYWKNINSQDEIIIKSINESVLTLHFVNERKKVEN